MKKRLFFVAALVCVLGCNPARAGETKHTPVVFGSDSSLTIRTGVTVTFESGSVTDFAAGSSVDFTGATVTGLPAGSGTVTSVSVTSANGVSGTVATSTTTPAITISLGAITPTSVNGVTLSGSSMPSLAVTGTTAVSGTNTGDQDLSGYATKSGANTMSGANTYTGAVTISGAAVTVGGDTTGALVYLDGSKVPKGLKLPANHSIRRNAADTGYEDYDPSSVTGALPDPTGHAGQYLGTDGITYSLSTPTGAGDVMGPGSSVTDHIATFADVSGTLLQDSGHALSEYVPGTRTVNGHALTSNVTVTAADLSLVIGTNVQSYDADLTIYAGITPSANVQSLLGAADYAAMRTQLGDTTAAISGTDIDWSSAATRTKTLSGNITFTFSNTGSRPSIVVALTNTASNYTVTWPTVIWQGGVTPTQTIGAKTDIYTFIKIGSNIYGVASQNF